MGKKTITNLIKFLIYAGCVGVLGLVMLKRAKPQLRENPIQMTVHSLQKDSTLLDRHYGDVNLAKFIELASRKPRSVFDPANNMVRTGDSITFSTSTPAIFFGSDDNGEWWRNKYKDLPISFPDEHSFRAAVHMIDSVEYIVIPYQILFSLANSFRDQTQPGDKGRKRVVEDKYSLSGPGDLDRLPHNGSLIQTGGLVFQHVSEVLQENRGRGKSSRQQLEILWEHAYHNWLYVHDPYTGTDTWRSATETIESYYFAQKKGYSGDCDDFAILMASFARQLGFDSHVKTAFNASGGHAYAEFYDNGTWVPLDWFSSQFGGEPFKGTVIRTLDDI